MKTLSWVSHDIGEDQFAALVHYLHPIGYCFAYILRQKLTEVLRVDHCDLFTVEYWEYGWFDVP